MKKIGEYTTRGSVRTDGALNRIILDDGTFQTGYRVVEFRVGPNDIDNTTGKEFIAKLMTDDDGSTGINWNWENNEEIAWASVSWDANGISAPNEFNLVDPDNLVIQDLFIVADEGVGSLDVKMNYFIRLEKYEITDWQGALGMVRNKSQG
jgi:hypothetical protein